MQDKEFDATLRRALTAEDAELLEELSEEPSLLELTLQTLRGRNRWATGLAMVAGVVFLVLAIYCAWSFYQTPAAELKALLGWSLGLLCSMLALSMIKLWSWMEIEKYSTVREIKRLELQVSLLARHDEEAKR